MTTIRILDVPTARDTVLRRHLLDDTVVPAAALEKLAHATRRPVASAAEGVAHIIADVRAHGDEALRHYSAALDGHEIGSIAVPPEEIEAAYARLDPSLREALHRSADRIQSFHQRQLAQSGDWLDEEGDSRLGQLIRPLERVGIYAPGGRALYPSSLLMAAVPARVAGVKEIVVISPPSGDCGEEETEKRVMVADVTLAAAQVAGGAQPLRVFQVGGAQGIAALAYGTESVPRVDKILGPGGLFVVLAMKQVFGAVGIAGLPGPTETLLIADNSAAPALVAADLLAQAEHDVLASALLLTPSRALADQVAAEVETQLAALPRQPIVEGSLARGSAIVLTADLDEALALANDYAPEHLCLLVEDPWALVPKVEHAGGVFVGETACEALGDYIVGPSHIMPTNRTARFSSPVNVRDFQKIISLFGVGPNTLRETGPTAIRLAEAEGLQGHAAAIRKRL
ncbi:MAG: histidinol dehydrogenase [Ardenticatenaceae bacterium]|nr:histidinol dehydrogenase [Ardenticatenaceae bacterium]